MGLSTAFGQSYTDNLIGTLLAIFGNLLVSISLTIQKLGHVTLAGTNDHRAFYRTKTWWCGFVLACLGESANFTSYAFAPLCLVAPLNVVSLLSSSILGFIFLREKLKTKEFAKRYGLSLLGCFLTIGGTFLFVSFGPNSHEKLDADNVVKHIVSWPVVLYMFLGIFSFCLLLYFYKRRSYTYLIIILLLVALLGSVTLITVKAVSAMLVLTIEGSMQLLYPIFYVLFVCMCTTVVFQARFLSQACVLHDSSVIASVNYIVSTIFAIIAGTVFYEELIYDELLHISMFLLGIVVCFLGAFLITRNRKRTKGFEPYVTMDMANGVPTIHDSQSAVQPDNNGTFSYGALVNNDAVAPAPLPVNLQHSPVRSSQASPKPLDLKKD